MAGPGDYEAAAPGDVPVTGGRARKSLPMNLKRIMEVFNPELHHVVQEAKEPFILSRAIRIFARELFHSFFYPATIPVVMMEEGMIGLYVRHYWGWMGKTKEANHTLPGKFFVIMMTFQATVRWLAILLFVFGWEDVVETHHLQADFWLCIFITMYGYSMVAAKWANRSKYSTDRMYYTSSRRDEELLWGWIPLPTSVATFETHLAGVRAGVDLEGTTLLAVPADESPAFLTDVRRRRPEWMEAVRRVPSDMIDSWEQGQDVGLTDGVLGRMTSIAHRDGCKKDEEDERYTVEYWEVPLKTLMLEVLLKHSLTELATPPPPPSEAQELHDAAAPGGDKEEKSPKPPIQGKPAPEYKGISHPLITLGALLLVLLPSFCRFVLAKPGPPPVGEWKGLAFVAMVAFGLSSLINAMGLLIPMFWVFILDYRRRLDLVQSFAHLLPTRLPAAVPASNRVRGLRRRARDGDMTRLDGPMLVMTPRALDAWMGGFRAMRMVGSDLERRISFGLGLMAGTFLVLFAYILLGTVTGRTLWVRREPFIVCASLMLFAFFALYALYIIYYGDQLAWMPRACALLMHECKATANAVAAGRGQRGAKWYYLTSHLSETCATLERSIELLEAQHEMQPLMLLGVVEFSRSLVRGWLVSMSTYLVLILNQIEWSLEVPEGVGAR